MSSSSVLTGPEKYSWSDSKCRKLAFMDFFPSHVTDTDIQKEIVNNFLNFYLSGKVKKGMTVCDVIFAAVSVMPQSFSNEQFIWPCFDYEEHGTLFYISAEDKLMSEIRGLQLKKSSQKDEDTADQENQEQLNKDPPPEHEPVASDDAENSLNCENEGEKSETAPESPSTSDVSIDPKEENIAEKDIHTDENETQSTNENNHGETVKVEMKRPTDKLFSPDKWKRNFKGNRQTITLNYGPVENAAFTGHCNKLLDVWRESKEARIELKMFFGYIALTLLRATAKNPKHLTNTFSSERFITSLRQLIVWEGPFSAPHKKCLKKSHRFLTKKDVNITTMFAKMVFCSSYCLITEELSVVEFRQRILTTTVLSHTFDYGLGTFNLLSSLQTSGASMKSVYDVTTCEETKESWDNLNCFINQYLSEKEHCTYHWARIMDDNAFRALSCQYNYGLSVILAVFIEKELTKANVWEADWVKKNAEQLEYYKALGAQMHHKFTVKKPIYDPFSELNILFF